MIAIALLAFFAVCLAVILYLIRIAPELTPEQHPRGDGN